MVFAGRGRRLRSIVMAAFRRRQNPGPEEERIDSMAKKFYTVLLVPDASSQIRTFHIAKSVLGALAAAAALVFVAFLFFIYQAVSLNGHMLELRRLRVGATPQGHMLGKGDCLEAELTGVREFDARLRAAAGPGAEG